MTKRLWAMGILKDDKTGEPKGIWLMTDGYNEAVNEKIKRLPTPRWHKNSGRWRFPLHFDVCTGVRKIADEYGADLKIGEQLLVWAQGERERVDLIPDVQGRKLIDLPRVREEAPRLWAALKTRPFQTVGAAFAARNRSCLIADQPGLGKTLQAIGAVVESGITGPVLVVAPKAAAKITWPDELAKWVPGERVVHIGAHLKSEERAHELLLATGAKYFSDTDDYGVDENASDKRVWVVVSPNYIRAKCEVDQYQNYVYVGGKKVLQPVQEGIREMFDVRWSAIIVDESHDTLAGNTGNKKNQSAQRQGLGMLEVDPEGLRIALSGTPFRGKESYLWGQLNWLRPDLFRSYWRWCEDHFEVDKSGFGWTVGGMLNAEGIYAEAAQVMIRRTKEEVADDLPPKEYPGSPLDADDPDSPVAVWLDMLPRQKRAYDGMVKGAAAELEGGTILTNGVLAEMTRLKQLAGSFGKIVNEDQLEPCLPSNKFEWLVNFLDERNINKAMLKLQGGSRSYRREVPKIVVVSQFAGLLDCFEQELSKLGIPTHKFTGGTSDKDRSAIKEDWQNNPESSTRVMLLSTKAGGVSLTLDAADEMVILDETWSAADQEQVEDRIHRLSRTHQVRIWKVFSRCTIEEGIARANYLREVSMKSIIDGERGVEFTRNFLLGKVSTAA